MSHTLNIYRLAKYITYSTLSCMGNKTISIIAEVICIIYTYDRTNFKIITLKSWCSHDIDLKNKKNVLFLSPVYCRIGIDIYIINEVVAQTNKKMNFRLQPKVKDVGHHYAITSTNIIML